MMKNGWQRGSFMQTYGHFHLYEGLLFRDGNILAPRDRLYALYVDTLSPHKEQICLGFIPLQQDTLLSVVDAVVDLLTKRMGNIFQTKQWFCETQQIEQKKTYERILADWEPIYYLVESSLREIEDRFQLKRRTWQFDGWVVPMSQPLDVFERFSSVILTVSSDWNLQSTLPPPYYDLCIQTMEKQFIRIGFLSGQTPLEQQSIFFLQAWLDSQSTSLSIGQNMLKECSSSTLCPLLQETVTLMRETLLTVQKKVIP